MFAVLLLGALLVAFLRWVSKTTIPAGPGTVLGEDRAVGRAPVGGSFFQAVQDAAGKAGVNPDLATAVVSVESNWRPDAVSPKGAVGLFQLMPATAAGLGVDPYDPGQNIAGGTQYLADLVNRYGGDYESALAAYNWGPGRVDKAKAQYGDDWAAHLPAETDDYIDNVINAIGG